MVSNAVILAGAIPAALLAIAVDLILALVEQKLTPSVTGASAFKMSVAR
jgi:ABC-type proline/glycine betaine transport system permease subunit